jgi:acyl carrier protein
MPGDLDDDTPLISSGLFDSLALFHLMLWIETKAGAPVDPAALDIGQAWNSIRLIVEFIEHRRSGSSPKTPASVVPRYPTFGLRIETYKPTHARDVAKLQAGLWSSDPELNLRYLWWKYEENPYCVSPRIYLAYDGTDLVGMRGFYPSRWEIGRSGQVEDVLVADDLIVRTDHRNQGVVTGLMQTAVEDLHEHGTEYVFNLSGGALTVLGSMAMGWRNVGNLKPFGRSGTAHTLLAAFRNRLSASPILRRYRSSRRPHTMQEAHPFAKLDRCSGVRPMQRGLHLAIGREPRAKDMAMLIDRLGYDGRIRHVRDETYLAWRYRNPLNEYRFFYAASDELHGYLVLKWTRQAFGPNDCVQIVDWEADDAACHQALLDAALSASAVPELVTWTATLSTRQIALLSQRGFAPAYSHLAAHGQPCILVRACDPGRPHEAWRMQGIPLLNLGQWDMRMIYSMAG